MSRQQKITLIKEIDFYKYADLIKHETEHLDRILSENNLNKST